MTKSMQEPPRPEGSMKQTWHVLGNIGPLFSDGGLKNWELLLGRDRLLARPLGIGLSLKAGVMAGIGGGLGIDLPVHLPLSVHLRAPLRRCFSSAEAERSPASGYPPFRFKRYRLRDWLSPLFSSSGHRSSRS